MLIECVVLLLTLISPTGTDQFCVRSTVTQECEDDILRWETDASPLRANILVETYAGFVDYGDLGNVLLSSKLKQAGAKSEPLRCEDEDITVCVFAVDLTGLQSAPKCHHWRAGGGRFLDDTNTDGVWAGIRMCGVEP